ncbi:spore coat U domain-containing protein [Erythrobacter alti]|uniref:Csu type fimbrial protein n=1 Tax=Erythrobacter alti TaxID=1896145 RepID=UPI0030F4A9FB
MNNTRSYAVALAAVPIVLLAQPAAAQDSTSGTMPVSATVLENCTVVSSAMAFGPITDVGASNVDSTATLTLTCTANASYEIQLDDGVNADSGQRRLANAGNDQFLNYDIYQNLARSTRWGDDLGIDTVSGSANVLGISTVTAYGRIPQGVAKVPAGLYADTITVTVNF